jgi:hypothetical protein
MRVRRILLLLEYGRRVDPEQTRYSLHLISWNGVVYDIHRRERSQR